MDNSCAGGTSAVFLASMAARSSARPVLVVGVEKMWTGDRAATLAGIEDGLPADYRADMHARFRPDGPGGSILMGLNDLWARSYMDERGATVEQIAAAAVKARRHASLNPLAQVQRAVTLDEVLSAPKVAGVLTRLMCSSFTDGAAAVVLAGPAAGAASRSTPHRRLGGPLGQRRDRLPRAARARSSALAWEAFGFGPGDVDLVELHDATSAEELYALESLGFFEPGEAGPATLAGDDGHRRAGADREPERRPGGPGPPAGRDRHRPDRRTGHPSAGPGRGPSGARGPPGGGRQHRGRRSSGDAAYVGIHAVSAAS